MDDNTLEALIKAAKAQVEQPDEPGTHTAYTLLLLTSARRSAATINANKLEKYLLSLNPTDPKVVPPAKELSDTPLLYYNAYNPNQEFYKVGNRSVKGIFHPNTYNKLDGELPPSVAFMKRYYNDTGVRL
ncbi:hypothetical protein EsH8_XV_000046 [Colletotrichum jinshuiense]